ncbi:MAG: excinuclease ABC subunit UvrC [Deltaproteobacteria bacterium]|nr:excinuclease ABC subunit UvrC [Deltaproteobacteria bacterium]
MHVPENIQQRLSRTSQGPGVYLMKDEHGRILYVGKAANLKKRVSSYFKPGHKDPKTRILVGKIADFSTILTTTEHEALVLESNLIKKHRPRYNVVLKDGKRYPSLRVDLRQDYPALEVVRKVKKDGARYFGPFTSVGAARETLKIIQKTFKVRRCGHAQPPKRERPCIQFQMGHCMGPCALPVDTGAYHEMIAEVIQFLQGRAPALIRKYQEKMNLAAQREEYEKAAEYRDKMFAMKRTVEKQVAVTTDFGERDVVALEARPEGSAVTVFHVRGGLLVGSENHPFLEAVSSERSMLQDFLLQYFAGDAFVPQEVLLSEPVPDPRFVEHALGEARGGRVHVHVPKRGEKARLVDMARQNAADCLDRRLSGDEFSREVRNKLARRLRLPGPPSRVECFDVSHTRGAHTVAGRVVFMDGEPEKGDWRRYNIRGVEPGDDYGTMRQALLRRFSPEKDTRPWPDLLLVDGGKGQLSMAVSVLEELGIADQVPVAGIAKPDKSRKETEDKVFLPGQANPVAFGRDQAALLFLCRVRDEAHRFAVALHRKQRGKAASASVLDAVPGVGEKRKKALLRHFRSVKNLREASVEDIAEVKGLTRPVAEKIHQALNSASG